MFCVQNHENRTNYVCFSKLNYIKIFNRFQVSAKNNQQIGGPGGYWGGLLATCIPILDCFCACNQANETLKQRNGGWRKKSNFFLIVFEQNAFQNQTKILVEFFQMRCWLIISMFLQCSKFNKFILGQPVGNDCCLCLESYFCMPCTFCRTLHFYRSIDKIST